MNSSLQIVVGGLAVILNGGLAVAILLWVSKRIVRHNSQIGVNTTSIQGLVQVADKQHATIDKIFKKMDEDASATSGFRQDVCKKLGAVCQELKITDA